MPIKIGEYIREKKAKFREDAIKAQGAKVAGMASRGRQAERYNNLVKIEDELKQEINTANASRKERTLIGKAKKKVGELKKYKESYDKKKGKKKRTLGNTGFGGTGFNEPFK